MFSFTEELYGRRCSWQGRGHSIVNSYPWDTFTIDDEDGEQVCAENPQTIEALPALIEELFAHIEDLGSDS